MKDLEAYERRISVAKAELNPIYKEDQLKAIILEVIRFSSRTDLTPEETAAVVDMLVTLHKLVETPADDRED